MGIEEHLISVVIPNFNNSDYIKSSIESVLNQTYENLEVVVVDDCSTDNSCEIVEKIILVDKRVRLLRNEKNSGVTFTRDRGIKEARGEFISTLDSDDLYLNTNKIVNEYSLLKASNFDKYQIGFSGVLRIDESDKPINEINGGKEVSEGEIFMNLLIRQGFIPRDFLFSKKIYEEVDGFDLNLPIYEDWDLKIRMSQKANFKYTGEVGIGYRFIKSSLSRAKTKKKLYWLNYIFDKNVPESQRDSLLTKFKSNLQLGFSSKVKNKIKKTILSLRR